MKPYTDSPQYDESRNRFEHPAGYRNDKGLFDVLGLAGAFLTREDDPAEKNGKRRKLSYPSAQLGAPFSVPGYGTFIARPARGRWLAGGWLKLGGRWLASWPLAGCEWWVGPFN